MANVRKLEKRDKTALVRLFQQLTEREVDLSIDELLADRAVTTIIIEENGAVAGTASLVCYYLPTAGKVGKIEDVIVDEQFRGKGFGRTLIEELIAIAKNNKLKKSNLQAVPNGLPPEPYMQQWGSR